MNIDRLLIYPIKSCAAIELDCMTFDSIGPCHDRRYMLVNEAGVFLTQRQQPKMAHIIPKLTESGLVVQAEGMSDCHISHTHQESSVTVWRDQVAAYDCGDDSARWFSEYLNVSCRLVAMPAGDVRRIDPDYVTSDRYVGFADGFPLLVINQASIDFLSGQLGRSLDPLRFRPNLIISGTEAFSEQFWKSLVLSDHQRIDLVKPCERCVIPLRDRVTLEREADVTEVLKQHCRPDKKIIFGQNGLTYGVEQLKVGQAIQEVVMSNNG